jgi:hypothetical protein
MRAGIILLLFAAGVARADSGDLSAGPLAAAGWPEAEGRAGLVVRWGLGDWLSLDARGAGALGDVRPGGCASLGLVLAWDVLAWVPEARLAAGTRLHEEGVDGRLVGGVGVRRYLSLDLALGLELAAEWSPDGWLGVASLDLLFSL